MTLQRILGAAALTLVITAASAAAAWDPEGASAPAASVSDKTDTQANAANEPAVDPGG